jgi:hypothetical protein
MMDKKIRIVLLAWLLCPFAAAQTISWPEITTESKPAARWWWMGSAVDKENLTHNLNAYAKAGNNGVVQAMGYAFDLNKI